MANVTRRMKKFLKAQLISDYNEFCKQSEGILNLPEIPSNLTVNSTPDLWKLRMFVRYQEKRLLGSLVGYTAPAIPSRKWYVEMRKDELESIFGIGE